MFNPDEFLKLSEILCNDDRYDDEARCRTAISRIYYSVFLKSYIMLMNRGIIFDKPGTIHKEVQSKLHNFDSKIGSKLESLHQNYRVHADYFIDDEVNHHMVNEAFKLAKNISSSILEKYG